jgi:hypothetical protein
VQADERLLGDEHAVALDLELGEIEGRLDHRLERCGELLVLGGHAVELLAVRLHGERLDLVQAVELGLEVVVQGRGSDADGLGDVGPLRVLVPLPAEVLGGGRDDRVALAARGSASAA